MGNPKVLIVATSRKTRGGITSVIKAHETGEQWNKYHCRWIETHRDGGSFRKLWYLITALIEYLLLLSFYDIVHIHVGLRASVRRKLIFARLAKLYGKKVIIHFHPATERHLFDEELSSKIKCLFDCSDRLLVLSPQWITWINSAFVSNSYKMQVIYNPCPCVKVKNVDRQNIVLYAGILTDRKGYNRLIEAFSKISCCYRDWKLVFAGNGEIEEGKKIAKEYGVDDSQIEFLGWISGEKKDLIFSSASIYCLPSWGEGFPMGVLDAMSYGVPVITTPVGGIEQVLHNGVDCLIFDTYNIEALTKSMVILMDSKEKRNQMVLEAKKMVDTVFNVKNITDELGLIYQELYAEIS